MKADNELLDEEKACNWFTTISLLYGCKTSSTGILKRKTAFYNLYIS